VQTARSIRRRDQIAAPDISQANGAKAGSLKSKDEIGLQPRQGTREMTAGTETAAQINTKERPQALKRQILQINAEINGASRQTTTGTSLQWNPPGKS
jgi:hypothetical protein